MKTLRKLIISVAAIAAVAVAAGCASSRPPDNKALREPGKYVLDQYLKIQTALAEDSMDNVAQNATAISIAIRIDEEHLLDVRIAKQADAIAEARDIGKARDNFKALSALLIEYLVDRNLESDTYTEVYCPMAEASWLQKGAEVKNPYLGDSMPGCGIVKRTF